MYNYKTLEEIDMEVIHKAFVKAFSDYQLTIDMPLWKFTRMLERKGYVPEYSMGVFHCDNLIGFILNGLRERNGVPTVYDVGTGVIPGYRKQGLTTNMFHRLLSLIKSQGARQYLLEVLQQNTSALELYKRQDFQITRGLKCFRISKSGFQSRESLDVQLADSLSADEWEQVKEFWDYMPSWQNSTESVCALNRVFKYSVVRIDNRIAGYGIIEADTGDVPQLAVDKSCRRRGVASAVLSGLAKACSSDKLVFLNIDDTNIDMQEFLTALGFENFVNQYEMLLKIDD